MSAEDKRFWAGIMALAVVLFVGLIVAAALALSALFRGQGAGLALCSGLVGGSIVGLWVLFYAKWNNRREEAGRLPRWKEESWALLENQKWCVVQEIGGSSLRRVSGLYDTQEEALAYLAEYRGAGYRGLSVSGRYFSAPEDAEEWYYSPQG